MAGVTPAVWADVRRFYERSSNVAAWVNNRGLTRSGRQAIEILRREPGIDIVLMDIMMPEMDGMETMQAIRQVPELKALPIIAVTAKAMKGDREKCIEAGAWDYLSKPVDTDQLVSLMRVWLYQ